jgi:hypothetical protein
MIPRHLFCFVVALLGPNSIRVIRTSGHCTPCAIATSQKLPRKGTKLTKRHCDFKAAKPLALGPRPGKPRANTFLDHRAFELGKHAQHWSVALPLGVYPGPADGGTD